MMNRLLKLLFRISAYSTLILGLALICLYFWDTGQGTRASGKGIRKGDDKAHVQAQLGEPSGSLRVSGGLTIKGMKGEERWFYGPIFRWSSLTDFQWMSEVIRTHDLLLLALGVFDHRANPGPKDMVVDFDKNGRVVEITKPKT